MAKTKTIVEKEIVLFDGVCNFCNNSVNFIINHDPKGHFRFAALQSDFGRQKLKEPGYHTKEFDSLVLLSGDKVYKKSSAALRIARNLSGLYPLLYGLMVIPPFIRHWAYDLVARNRYKWFGKRDACRLPAPELKSRFL